MNRPDVLQPPQFGLAPQDFATPVLYGAPSEQRHGERDRCGYEL